MSTAEASALDASGQHRSQPDGEAAGTGGQDVGGWLQRMAAEFDELQTVNAKLVARIQELERMTVGVAALSDEELLAELPTRMSRALQSAQSVGQEIVKQARDREAVLLQHATETSAEIGRRAQTDAHDLRQQASDEARAHVEEARRLAEEIASQARAQRGRVIAELEARRAGLDRESERLEAGRTYLWQVFATLKEALEEPARAGFNEEAPAAPSDAAPPSSPERARSRHPRNGSRGARHDEPRPHDEVVAAPPEREADPASPTSPPLPVKILFVCGSNLSTSPMAALLLGRRLADLGIRAAVRSAGLEQRGPRPPAPVLQVLRARGLELQGHRSVVLNTQLLGEADLVLGMALQHVQAAAHLAPQAWPYTFALKELVSFERVVRPRGRDEALEDVLARVHRARGAPVARSTGERPVWDPGDYVSDDIGYSYDACERVAEELEGLIDRLVAFLWWGPVPPTRPPHKVFDDASA